MRKEQSFVIYPFGPEDKVLKIQSDGRMGIISREGKIKITSKNETYPNMMGLTLEIAKGTAKDDIATEEELKMIRENISGFFGNDVVMIMGNTGMF